MAKSKSKKIQPKSSKTNLVWGLLLFVISFILYANTIGHDNTLDDIMLIKENAYTQAGLAGVGDILTNDMFSGNNPGYKSDLSGGRYRPLSQITFAIEYELFGLNPQIGHFINILLFALTPFMIFIFLSLLMRTDGKDFNWYSSLPFLAGLFYAVHPIHTEAVANIKGRDEIMSMLLVLVCFYYFIKYIDFEKTKYLIYSVIIFFLALMSKENAITFLAVMPLVLIMFREKNVGESLKKILPYLAVAVVFVIIRQSIVGGGKELEIPELMNEPFYGMSFLEKYGTILVTLFNYIKLQFIPYPLTYDYYPYHIAKTNLFEILPILAILIHLLLIYIAYRTWKSKPILSFAILYYFITLSIVSNLFFTIGAFMNERFIYMPSLAVCIVFAWFVSDYLVNKKLPKNVLIGIIAVVTLTYSFLTVSRNPVWKDNFTLMTTDVNTSSNSAFGNYCAGLQYAEKMKTLTDAQERQSYFEKSQEYLYKAIEIHPRYSNAFIALGNIYYEKDKSLADSTIHYYQKSFEVYPGNYSVSLNLARLHRDVKKDAKSAEFYLNNCIKINPNKWEAYNDMGVIYFNTNRVSESVLMFENALSRESQNKQIYTNLAAAYNAMGDTEKANLYSNRAKMLR
jgi:protein O-mannosyl-transferase